MGYIPILYFTNYYIPLGCRALLLALVMEVPACAVILLLVGICVNRFRDLKLYYSGDFTILVVVISVIRFESYSYFILDMLDIILD